jgi:hypothetical protein
VKGDTVLVVETVREYRVIRQSPATTRPATARRWRNGARARLKVKDRGRWRMRPGYSVVIRAVMP